MLNKSSLHLAAQEYARRGWYVFPCIPNNKRPAVKDWGNAATLNFDLIQQWWEENSAYNVAIATGPSGLLVVDIDSDAAWEHWLTHYDSPATYTVRTPRGGWHLYYKGTGPSTVSKLGPKIDTRGLGGYVLAPPSVVGVNPYIVTEGSPDDL